MPKIEVIRKGITPAVRPVPTDTTLAVVPVTLERMGREVETEDEEPVRVDSADDAFRKFKPSIHFETQAGEEATEFVPISNFAASRISARRTSRRGSRDSATTLRI